MAFQIQRVSRETSGYRESLVDYALNKRIDMFAYWRERHERAGREQGEDGKEDLASCQWLVDVVDLVVASYLVRQHEQASCRSLSMAVHRDGCIAAKIV